MRLHPSIYQAFQVVMRQGTISRAADSLGRSQPAVSRMIDKLEDSMGVKLFERRKGRVIPTHSAQLLLDEVERLFVSLESLDKFGERLEEGLEGGVGVAALPALGIEFLPEAISRFSLVRPQARVVLHVRMSSSVEKWVATQQVDFGLAETPFLMSGFGTRIFSDSAYVAAIPAGHPLATQDCVRPEHMAGERVIGWIASTSARRTFDDIMQGAGVLPRQVIECTMSAPICNMVRRDLGLALVDPFTAWFNRNSGIVFRPFVPRIPCRIALLLPDTRALTSFASDLLGEVETLRDEIQRAMD
ncbi:MULTISPECIES: LysR substrate-binding domain-containing protein [Rhizobium/Agrobacterium group]|uniref:LysR substrate-binding domain-containing protein n=1 Tax=Agrobacterium rosae TaxID=1972867 RepID=UPI002550BCE5|nr:LysR substrate-binding domain-containing protein [Agrobacterium rosae]MCM2436087.1 LysR family transcriptional regulator [Agrobacterium rosae]